MSRLRIDLEELHRAADAVTTVVSNFSRAEQVSHEVAGLTGHEGLTNRVREFADGWDVARSRISERLVFIANALGAIADTLEDVDLELQDAIGSIELPSADGGGG